jgi:hypothetical protein
MLNIILIIIIFILIGYIIWDKSKGKSDKLDEQTEELISLLEKLYEKDPLLKEDVRKRKQIITDNVHMISKSNLEEKKLKQESPTSTTSSFTTNKFVPYTHEEIIRLFTGLLIPEQYQEKRISNGESKLPINDKYQRFRPPADRESVNVTPNGSQGQIVIPPNGGGQKQNGEKTDYKFTEGVRLIDFSKLSEPKEGDDIFYGLSPRLFLVPRNQYTCGACWAFSAAGAIEAQITKTYYVENPQYISVQYFIDCTSGTFGCQGGFPLYVYQLVADTGFVVFENTYNYVLEQSKQCSEPENFVKFRVNLTGIISFDEKNAAFFPKNKIKEAFEFHSTTLIVPSEALIKKIKQILINFGPLTVYMYVDPKFPYYSDGIYTLTNVSIDGTEISPNHAVLIAGFGKDVDGNEYWIIRNSWGADWGIGGYVQVSMTSPLGGLTVPMFEKEPPQI